MKVKNKKGLRARLYIAAVFITTTILTSTSDAVMEAYRNIVSQNVIPVMSSVWFQIYGMFYPLPEHHDYHFSVTFYIPPSGGNVGGKETTGVSIPGEECRKSGGMTSSAPSGLNFEYWQNNVITEVYCSSSRVTVALIPQISGEKQIIYDGLFYEGKKIPFSGTHGRYNAGVLQLISTDRSEPIGDLVPINGCQKSGAC
ncbi:hypothetical protein [Dickeya lacustris]|uniref:Uncharacterized protein n=1 Tax=Dickeya lacustris TaxID=2259638 RepID=A0ABY8G9L7_9GAMM|nr:hypothetical protein [Dickeya lacustris]WFN56671.1 hypothetical protein O1Q98_05190 [Dickeya lacustris]